ncbi:MAG: type VI secretion system Vgr family protein, partial [Gaiellaceae bacterium]
MGLEGTEALSRLYSFRLDLAAANGTTVPFEQLLGSQLTLTMSFPGRPDRFFSGICSRFSERDRSGRTTLYGAEVVPKLWLLTKTRNQRIFQQKTVPDILRQLFAGLDVSYRLQGNYEPRNYCVQYRESDFDFASRLMEEEGIFYFFKHSENGHQLVLGDSPAAHPDLPGTLTYDPRGNPAAGSPIVSSWTKSQNLRSAKVTLRDHNFELPDEPLEASALIQQDAIVGQVTHHLQVPATSDLELYDYPGGYAQRFDGVDPGGGDQPGELEKIQPDGQRTARIRIGAEAAGAVEIEGASTAGSLTSGNAFTLGGHFDANGRYVLTEVEHSASLPDPGSTHLSYMNTFGCIPDSIPYRPPRATPRPLAAGQETAVVVGPQGEEIFTDKYSRIKVQFHWDREGKKDERSSCWIRVAQPPSHQGTLLVPDLGDEVVVAFEEGDPDRPIVIGRAVPPP